MKKLFSIALLLGLTACSSMSSVEEQKYVESRARAQELQDEINIGRTMAAKLMGHFEPFKGNPAALLYLNRVGRTMSDKVGRPELTYYFGIVDDPQINAFATPGGYVFVTTGLLRQISNESQLAAILGHEIAHINERHMYYHLRPKRDVGVENTVARIMARGNSELGKSLSTVVSEGLEILLNKGIDETKEREADSAGLVYAAQAGYDPKEFVTLIAGIHANEKKLKLASTAGDQSKRVAELEAVLREAGLDGYSSTNQQILTARYQREMKLN